MIVLSSFHVDSSSYRTCPVSSSSPFQHLILLIFTLVLFKFSPAIFHDRSRVNQLRLGLENISPDSSISINMSSSEDLTSDVRTRFSSHNPPLHLLHVWGWYAIGVSSVYPKQLASHVSSIRYRCSLDAALLLLTSFRYWTSSWQQWWSAQHDVEYLYIELAVPCSATGAMDRYTDCISNLQCTASLSALSAPSRFSTSYQDALPDH